MKKIIYLAMILIMATVVYADLGEELVTCSNFSCIEGWENVGYQGSTPRGWQLITSQQYCALVDFVTFNAFSSQFWQEIDISTDKIYNVTVKTHHSQDTWFIGELNLTLGGNKTVVFPLGNEGTGKNYSFIVKPINDDDLITISGYIVGNHVMYVDEISVKEILPPLISNHVKCQIKTNNKNIKITTKGKNAIIQMILKLSKLI
jgi:hypothetical protein